MAAQPDSKTPANPGLSARKVLIILLGGIGEFVQSLGAMRAIREAHPSAEITLLTTPRFAEFAQLFPAVDRVEVDGVPPSLKEKMALASRIRKAGFDITYDLQGDGRTEELFKLMNLPMRSPPPWSGPASEAAFPFTPCAQGARHRIDHLADQLHQAGLDAPGSEWPPQPDLGWVRPLLGDPPRLRPEYFGLSGAFMLMFPGRASGEGGGRWPAKQFGLLAQKIAAGGVTPVVIGTKADAEAAHEILRLESKAKSLVTRTDLFQIVALAERALYVLGNDTGPLHLATHTGARGFALLRDTGPEGCEAACPRGGPVIILKAEDLADMPAETVWQAILWSGLSQAPQTP